LLLRAVGVGDWAAKVVNVTLVEQEQARARRDRACGAGVIARSCLEPEKERDERYWE
jgi:hypothetical protein